MERKVRKLPTQNIQNNVFDLYFKLSFDIETNQQMHCNFNHSKKINNDFTDVQEYKILQPN